VHCFLPSLVKLNIDYCDELESFPGLGLPSFPAMGLSSKLESVDICKCNTLFAGRKQWDLQRLPSLSSFCFSGCEEVESFPEEDMLLPSTLTSLQISNLPHLKSLDVEGLQHLTSLRKSITALSSNPCHNRTCSLHFLIYLSLHVPLWNKSVNGRQGKIGPRFLTSMRYGLITI
jgi:hypothetical protein